MIMDKRKIQSTVYRSVICLLISAAVFAAAGGVLWYVHMADVAGKNYDYSGVSRSTGTVTRVDTYYSMDGYPFYIERMELESGECISIGVGWTWKDNAGDKVDVYTNGTNYSFRARDFAHDNTNDLFWTLLVCLLALSSAVPWYICFGEEGVFFLWLPMSALVLFIAVI
jgi:hypothetical protein